MSDGGSLQSKTAYPLWDTKLPSLPSRARFFKLDPIGIGTPEVESFTSYIGRLAAEHCVSPRKLLLNEVLAPAGQRASYTLQINGIGSKTNIAVTAFERMLLREDLHCMTLLPWRHIFSPPQLLRSIRAWCAICYDEMRREGKPIYDPLMWTLGAISICPKHGKQLVSACQHCKRQQLFLVTYYLPGNCSYCHQWLGATNNLEHKQTVPEPIKAVERAQQSHIIRSVGELLSYAPKIISSVTPESFVTNLGRLVIKEARGSINLFSDMVGIWSGSIRRLLIWATRLRLEVLCQLCHRLNLSPLQLLLDNGHDTVLGRHHILPKGFIPIVEEVTPWEAIKDKLLLALHEEPPPSLERVARRMGYYPPRIQRHFRALSNKISKRYWKYQKSKHPDSDEIKRIMENALEEEPPPSLQSVLRRLGCVNTGYYYYSNYPDLCFAITGRYKEWRNNPFHESEDQKRLKAALKENPPPSFSEIARRFRHNREFMRLKFPELSEELTSRYKHYQKTLRKEKAQSFAMQSEMQYGNLELQG